MADCLFITGTGRSGTSMIAGLFGKSGRFMGEALHPARSSNPKGFFESPQINSLNERILLRYLPRPFLFQDIEYGADAPRRTHTWLSRLPPGLAVEAQSAERQEIAALVARGPFCFKDPRFAFTLHNWTRECPPDWQAICIFRHPSAVVESILKEVHTEPYLRDFAISVSQVFEHWLLVYERLISLIDQRWLVVSYDRVLDGSALGRIAEFSGDVLDAVFPTATLNRMPQALEAPAACLDLYERLLAVEKEHLQ